jgi:hypothetical protein
LRILSQVEVLAHLPIQKGVDLDRSCFGSNDEFRRLSVLLGRGKAQRLPIFFQLLLNNTFLRQVLVHHEHALVVLFSSDSQVISGDVVLSISKKFKAENLSFDLKLAQHLGILIIHHVNIIIQTVE